MGATCCGGPARAQRLGKQGGLASNMRSRRWGRGARIHSARPRTQGGPHATGIDFGDQEEEEDEKLDLSEGGDALVVHSFSTNRICKKVHDALSELHLTTRSSAAANSDDDDDDDDEDLEVPNTITVVVVTPSLLHDANALRYLCAAVENEESTKIVVRVNGVGDDIFSEAVDVQHMASQVQTDILGMLDRLGVSVSELQKAFKHLAECDHVVCCVENGKPSYFEARLLRVYTRRALNLVQDGSRLTSGMTSGVGDVNDHSQEHMEERDPDVILFHAERSNLERGIVALLDDHLPNNFACSWLAEEEEEDSDDDDDEEDDIDEDDIDENIGRNVPVIDSQLATANEFNPASHPGAAHAREDRHAPVILSMLTPAFFNDEGAQRALFNYLKEGKDITRKIILLRTSEEGPTLSSLENLFDELEGGSRSELLRDASTFSLDLRLIGNEREEQIKDLAALVEQVFTPRRSTWHRAKSVFRRSSSVR